MSDVRYYGAYDESDSPIGMFRMIVDDDTTAVDLERFTEDGAWVPDPDAIAELRDTSIRPISGEDARALIAELGTRRDAEAEADIGGVEGGEGDVEDPSAARP